MKKKSQEKVSCSSLSLSTIRLHVNTRQKEAKEGIMFKGFLPPPPSSFQSFVFFSSVH